MTGWHTAGGIKLVERCSLYARLLAHHRRLRSGALQVVNAEFTTRRAAPIGGERPGLFALLRR